MGLPRGGARLSGMERTRRLRGVRVKFGDVGGEGERERGGGLGWEVGIGARVGVGRLGVGRIKDAGGNRREIEKGEGVRAVGRRELYI